MICCMQNIENDEVVKKIQSIKYHLSDYMNMVKNDILKSLKDRIDDNNGVICFCGWEYSSEDRMTSLTFDELLNIKYENLALLSVVVKTPDYFTDNEMFYEKVNAINEELNDIEEEIYNIISQDFVNTYRKEYAVTYDDDIQQDDGETYDDDIQDDGEDERTDKIEVNAEGEESEAYYEDSHYEDDEHI